MRIIRLFVTLIVFVVAVWAMLVWGLPWLITKSPQFCRQWNMTNGICAPNAYNKAQEISSWTKNNVPLSDAEFGKRTLSDAYVGLTVLENSAREKLGNDKVNLALDNVDKGIKSTEIVLNKQGFGSKLQDIPKNAQVLLKQARTALEQLRGVFDKTQRRAEDVSNAVNSTKKALDALSSVLPSATPSK